jgi:hypothetical protein
LAEESCIAGAAHTSRSGNRVGRGEEKKRRAREGGGEEIFFQSFFSNISTKSVSPNIVL